ncbi:hypothetical protein [Streptomyces mobaraensis]|uniref:Uncharacterized protein n=1 Tax=Streptomyces mobaraensis TaxID=35621 RepID=A0A5N5WCQ2_STRMB|nr:hypothetical protein [Streptomyces mobaraensis]KAB7850126.1 hypothetical protein FRZ00_05865 [Streptomyces mobaraensis]
MTVDSPVPLASAADLAAGQFADLVRDYAPAALDQLMVEATRQCEGIAGRRLAPFTAVPESHRAQGIDPDEYTEATGLPMDIQGTLGRSYADALGPGEQVRHCWLNEFAPRYPEMWTYANLKVTILRSYGGSQSVATASLIGAEPDSGHVWFSLGTFLPIGSLIRVTYDGGYTTVPADLARACKLLAASLVLGEIDPAGTQFGHDRGVLTAQAETILSTYQRS